MPRKLFTENEIILCTYIARYGRGLFNEKRISRIENRSEDSVKMKVQNIAFMLNEEGFEHSPDVSCLSGVTTGESGRHTNWYIAESLTSVDKDSLKQRCLELFK